jgi:phosphomevalonate kinase
MCQHVLSSGPLAVSTMSSSESQFPWVGLELFASICVLFVSTKYFRYRKRLGSGSSDALKTLTVSAPGKVLVAGGYLVLETPNMGITIAATSRFYSTIVVLKSSKKPAATGTCLNILVDSPQFYTQYEYAFCVDTDSLTVFGEEKNEFVEKCLTLTLSFIKQFLGDKKFREKISAADIGGSNTMGIKIRANNDFYSQIKELRKRGLPLQSSSLRQLPAFIPCPKDSTGKVEVAKTGMGSSAALTTSLVGVLLQWFEVIALPTAEQANGSGAAESRRIVHNLSQLVHANAQGKIGSGFDVAAAVYGTQLYRRFSADTFLDCLDDTVEGATIFKAVMSKPNDAQSTYNKNRGVPFTCNEHCL